MLLGFAHLHNQTLDEFVDEAGKEPREGEGPRVRQAVHHKTNQELQLLGRVERRGRSGRQQPNAMLEKHWQGSRRQYTPPTLENIRGLLVQQPYLKTVEQRR